MATDAIIQDVRRSMVALLLVGLGAGCASAPSPARATSIAVLPVVWRTRDVLPSLDERVPLAEGLGQVEAVEVSAPNPEPPCDAEDAECARRAGAEEGVERVLMASMAGLAETLLVRVTLLDVSGGTSEQTQQRVMREADAESVRVALRELGLSIAQPFAARPSDGLGPALVGTVVGVLVAGGVAVAVGVAAASGQDDLIRVVPP